MALAQESTGTQTATLDTEHTLATPTTNKTRVLVVNLANMVTGDRVEIRAKIKVLTGGAAAVYVLGTFSHAQIEPVVATPPIPSIFGATFTLMQTDGAAGRAYEWSVLTLD